MTTDPDDARVRPAIPQGSPGDAGPPPSPPSAAGGDGDVPEADNVVVEAEVDIHDLSAGRVQSRSLILEIFKDEVIRAAVALLLLLLLAIILLMALSRTETWAQTKEFLEIVFPAMTALLGSAVGFYFGTKSS